MEKKKRQKAINHIKKDDAKSIEEALSLIQDDETLIDGVKIIGIADSNVGMPLKLAFATVRIKNIHFNEYNPNKKKENDLDALSKSIDHYGFLKPPVLFYDKEKKELLCMDGEKRILVMKKKGHKEVPAYIVLEGISRVQAYFAPYLDKKLRPKIDKEKEAKFFEKLKRMDKTEFEKVIQINKKGKR